MTQPRSETVPNLRTVRDRGGPREPKFGTVTRSHPFRGGPGPRHFGGDGPEGGDQPDRVTLRELERIAEEGARRAPIPGGVVWYMAHPIGPYGVWTRETNTTRAEAWLVWFHDAWPQATVIAPYLHDLRVLPLRDDVPHERELGLRRMEAVARVTDAVVMVGGHRSNGMEREAFAARAARKPVLDWTYLGDWPPGHPLAASVLL